MYRLGERKLNHHKSMLLAGGVFLLVIVAGVLVAKAYFFKPDTSLGTTPPPVVRKITYNQDTRHFDESIFELDLPSDWKLASTDKSPRLIYHFQGSGTDSARSLDVYVDNVPAAPGVNRVVAVQGGGDHLVLASDVSDNCVSFTQNSQTDEATGTAPSKWGGVNFICDMGNYERDVVGTSSPEGINTVTLSGQTTGAHELFFKYTDNSGSSDYTIFIDALKSFKLE